MASTFAQNRLLFRTPPGSLPIPAGETVRLTAELPYGIPVADYSTIRVYCVCRINGTVPVSVFLHALEGDELIFQLDHFTVQPNSEITRTYDVPARALVVFAKAESGAGSSGIDFGVLGFGPPPQVYACAYQIH